MLVFPGSGSKNHTHQTHSLATSSIHEEFENNKLRQPYYPETKTKLENSGEHVGDFSIPCSSPFQLGYEYSQDDMVEVDSNSNLPFQANYDQSSISVPNESLHEFHTNLSNKHSLHYRSMQVYPTCTYILSNSSSIQTSQESTPLFQRPMTLAENTPTPTLASSGNSVVDLVPDANTTPTILTDSEDALFNQHLELLMEYTTSPLSKCGNSSIDCWLDFPYAESKQCQNVSQLHERQFAKDRATPVVNQSNRSIGYPAVPTYYSQNQLGKQFTNMTSCVNAGFQYVPWLRTINRNVLYNQSHQYQNRYSMHPSHNQLETKHVQPSKRSQKETLNLLNNNNSASNSIEIPKEQQLLHNVFNDDCKISYDQNNMDDSDYVPEEYGSDDEEYSDYDAADDDSEGWILPSSQQSRKRKNQSPDDSKPKSKRARKVDNKDEDSDNDLDPDDSSSQLKPRRKASESARNILMNWLVENEDHPYPSKKQKLDLAATTGLSLKQIVHWMSNIRKRRMIPLLSGRKKPSSAVDVKFMDDIHRRRAVLLSKRK